MTVNICTDSDGISHQVWAQQQASSCSIASIWMARAMVRQESLDESEWELARRTYGAAVAGPASGGTMPAAVPGGGLQSLGPQPAGASGLVKMVADTGLLARQVANVLRGEGLTVAHRPVGPVPLPVDTARIGPGRPAVVLVGWFRWSGGVPVARTGGHFIVAARRSSVNLTVYLDPWGGVLREIPNSVTYGGSGLIEDVIYLS